MVPASKTLKILEEVNQALHTASTLISSNINQIIKDEVPEIYIGGLADNNGYVNSEIEQYEAEEEQIHPTNNEPMPSNWLENLSNGIPYYQDPSQPETSGTEYVLKIDFDQLKNDHEKLKAEFKKMNETYEEKIKILYLLFDKHGASRDDDSASLVFDTSNIRPRLITKITYYDKTSEMVDLVPIFRSCPMCKNGISNQEQIGELYKQVLRKIYGEEDLRHYTAAEARVKKDFTRIDYLVISAIRDLIFDGFGLHPSDETEDNLKEMLKRSDVNKSIKTTNSWICNNARKDYLKRMEASSK
jgi:hypothetical protein